MFQFEILGGRFNSMGHIEWSDIKTFLADLSPPNLIKKKDKRPDGRFIVPNWPPSHEGKVEWGRGNDDVDRCERGMSFFLGQGKSGEKMGSGSTYATGWGRMYRQRTSWAKNKNPFWSTRYGGLSIPPPRPCRKLCKNFKNSRYFALHFSLSAIFESTIHLFPDRSRREVFWGQKYLSHYVFFLLVFAKFNNKNAGTCQLQQQNSLDIFCFPSAYL